MSKQGRCAKSSTRFLKRFNNSMNNTSKENSLNHSAINSVPSGIFDSLNDEQKNIVLTGNNINSEKEKDSGIFGKLLGANPKNASIHIALIICILLLLFCCIDLIHSFNSGEKLTEEIWNLIFPVITLSLGYIFGKGENR